MKGAVAVPSAGPAAGRAARAPLDSASGEGAGRLLSIGAAAAQAGVTERALRYYQEIGILEPSAHTKGGMRRYSQADLARVARIRELQTLLGLNLDEIAAVLRNEDRTAEIKAAYEGATQSDQRRHLLQESLALVREMRETVEAKRAALDDFLVDLDTRIARISAALDQQSGPSSPGPSSPGPGRRRPDPE